MTSRGPFRPKTFYDSMKYFLQRRLNIKSILLLQVASGENRVILSFKEPQASHPASQPAEILYGILAVLVITET